ncbi:MAG TPA: hypothetical protein PLA54_15045, partial [Spirochaetota bacterium]|nr:hypothetical protein [Spirochaetota bacterium]HQE60504.1 hypothetical protein [Spirochaetota bacterium]
RRKAGARNSPDKERAGISKGAGLAIEARSLLILSYETIRKPDFKGEAFADKSGGRTNWIYKVRSTFCV